nr:neuroblastoma-amplified sequence isoform X2 [Cavia porcellus]
MSPALLSMATLSSLKAHSPAPFLLPDGLVRLVNRQISWHLVLASNGKLLAAVQDQCVEIRSAKDDFTSIIGKCQVPKDPKPQWRRVAWSYDCTLLAYAESTGTVRVFDLMGSELFVIAPASSFAGDLSCAIAGLIFLEYKASAQWLAELLVINYRGELRSYLVSVETNQSYQESHSFSFSSHYPHGISTAIYHPAHRLLLVGGCEASEPGISKAASCGLSAWRVLSGSPYYKQVASGGDRVTVGLQDSSAQDSAPRKLVKQLRTRAMDASEEATGTPAGPTVPQGLLEEMIWFFRVEDAAAWNYSILALTAVVVAFSLFLLVRNVQANRNRKLQPQDKETPALLHLKEARTSGNNNSLNNLGEILLTEKPALVPLWTELKEQETES